MLNYTLKPSYEYQVSYTAFIFEIKLTLKDPTGIIGNVGFTSSLVRRKATTIPLNLFLFCAGHGVSHPKCEFYLTELNHESLALGGFWQPGSIRISQGTEKKFF